MSINLDQLSETLLNQYRSLSRTPSECEHLNDMRLMSRDFVIQDLSVTIKSEMKRERVETWSGTIAKDTTTLSVTPAVPKVIQAVRDHFANQSENIQCIGDTLMHTVLLNGNNIASHLGHISPFISGQHQELCKIPEAEKNSSQQYLIDVDRLITLTVEMNRIPMQTWESSVVPSDTFKITVSPRNELVEKNVIEHFKKKPEDAVSCDNWTPYVTIYINGERTAIQS